MLVLSQIPPTLEYSTGALGYFTRYARESGLVKHRAVICPKKDAFSLFLSDGHRSWSIPVPGNEKRIMAKTYHAPLYVRMANVMMMTLLRGGVKVKGYGGYPIYLLTVRGRKSGNPRTVPLALLEHSGTRCVACAGVGDWVLNLRAAGEATLTRGRRSETVRVRELPPSEAAFVFREEFKNGYPFAREFSVTADASLEEFERAVIGHPIFALESIG